MIASRKMIVLLKRSRGFLALIVVVIYAKRKFPKASLIWLVKRLLGRIFSLTISIRIPEKVKGRGEIKQVGAFMQKGKCKKALVVTDERLQESNIRTKCENAITNAGLRCEVFYKVRPNPPAGVVEEGFQTYQDADCDCIVALGGGSTMDTAKVIAAKICNPMPIETYQGFFKATMGGMKSAPPFISIPTTAGTTAFRPAALIALPEQKKQIAIVDPGLVPHVTVLDPEMLGDEQSNVPKQIMAQTGMDALTHAIESYMGCWSTAYTRNMSLAAIGKVFSNVQKSYDDSADMDAREAMLLASFEAGIAFTRASVGYVHAIAHQLGVMFRTPHGDANAMLLPHVLEYYLHDELAKDNVELKCCQQCCEMAVAAGLRPSEPWVPTDAEDKRTLAKEFVAKIKDMQEKMNIPKDVPSMTEDQVTEVATRALAEAHGRQHVFTSAPLDYLFDLGYPVPKYMTLRDCEDIVRKILPAAP